MGRNSCKTFPSALPPHESMLSLPMPAGHRIADRLAIVLLVLISLGTHFSRDSKLLAEEASSDGANFPAHQDPPAETQRIKGSWRLQDTENFCICCPTGMDPAPIGRTCESLRAELTRKWLGDSTASQPWTARCYVVVHPSIDSYLREVGSGGKNTLGSSLTKTENGRIVSRRIDLRGDVAEPLCAALPHELTHVLLADVFPGETLSRWADEGIAMLADPPEKLARHGQDLRAALRGRRSIENRGTHGERELSLGGSPRHVLCGERLRLSAFSSRGKCRNSSSPFCV